MGNRTDTHEARSKHAATDKQQKGAGSPVTRIKIIPRESGDGGANLILVTEVEGDYTYHLLQSALDDLLRQCVAFSVDE